MDGMVKKRLLKSDVAVGEAIPWPICNSEGLVYFKSGFVFHSDKSLKRLDDIELYYAVPGKVSLDNSVTSVDSDSIVVQSIVDEKKVEPIYPVLDDCIARIDTVYERLHNHDKRVIADINQLIEIIHGINQRDRDCCIGAIHLYRKFSLKKLKPILLMLLCEIQAAELNVSAKGRYSLLASALTCNMVDIDKNFDIWSSGELFDQGLTGIAVDTIALLAGLGIEDRLWFDILMQSCGSSQGIIEEAAVLRVASNYLYQVTLGNQGKPLQSRSALQHIFKQAERQNEKVYIGFIKDLGIYPPGSIVRLGNGEVGIVTRKSNANALHVEVAVLCLSGGNDCPLPVYRISTQKGCSVVDVLDPGELLIADPELLWLNRDSNRGM